MIGSADSCSGNAAGCATLFKKKSHEEEIRAGLAQLRALGVALEDASPALVGPLKEHLGKEPALDLAIIFALGKIADRSALELLTTLGKEATHKEIKKEIRRSLFKLAQKGMRVPETVEGKSPGPKPIFNLTPEIEGYLSSVDGAGGRLVWLARPQAGSGLQLLQGMVNDREGLQQVGGTLVRRKEFRQMAQEIREKHGVAMIPVPWEYADQVLYEGFEKARASGRGGIESYTSLRALFATTKPRPRPHPIFDRLDTDEARSGAWRELSRRLLEEPELRPWILDQEWLEPYLEQLQEAQDSRLVLNPLQKEERLAGIVREAVKALFSGDTGRLFQRRMEDMALYLFETKRVTEAKLAFAVALQLKEGEVGPLDISLLTGLVQKSIAFYASQEKAKSEEEPSLIVKP